MSLLNLLLFLLPLYMVIRLGRIKARWFEWFIFALIEGGFLAGAILLQRPWIFYVGASVTLLLFDLFYDDEPFSHQVRWFLPTLILVSVFALVLPLRIGLALTFGLGLLGIWAWTKALNWQRLLLVSALFVTLTFVPLLPLEIALVLLSFLTLDQVLLTVQKRFDLSSEAFQRSLMASHYQEVKDIYLQMRGWRHDYHNHLQSFKSYLAQGQVEELGDYLNELEAELDSIDTLVKSGNTMVDAILNSKLSLARKHEIDLNVKVAVLAALPISDVDLCVILGNLMDNAIEACRQIPLGERWLRLYLDTQGEQLYLSIQNAAKEILDFNERNYISTKRGDHGLGLKRVSLLVEKYQGFLNLQNEPGIFAVEVSVPLDE